MDSGDPPSTPRPFRYRAFISYSHRDKAVADWLHRAVETYRIPANLVGGETALGRVPRRLTPIFRDRDELSASGDLGGTLTDALRESLFLVVICSPAAVASRWVEEEIASFKRMHGEGRVLAVIAAGEPYASSSAQGASAECFPRSLRYKVGPDGEASDVAAEPIAADLRAEGDGKRLAKLKIVAGLAGLRLDDLAQREAQRRIRRLITLASVSMVGMVLAGALALYADAQRIEADQQRHIAEQESATARASSDFLAGTFELANPATDNPRTITALTILARGADRARVELAGQPVVQSRLLATLSKAYLNLGLFAESQRALEQSLHAIRRAGPQGVEALLQLASTYLQQGRMDKAMATVRQARAALGPDLGAYPGLRGLAAATEGRIFTANGDPKGGIAALNRALRLYRAAPDTKPRILAKTLNNLGLLLSDDGQFAAADRALSEALAIYRHSLGERHLVTGQTWFALAQNDLAAGKLPLAEQRIGKALAIERAVLDPDNAILGDSRSLQGQILQGEGKLDAAANSLQAAVTIYRKAFKGPHYLIGIASVYLALIEAHRGHTAAALADIAEAKHNYDVSYGKLHPNHGDLLVNRATILAMAGRRVEARADCAAGIRILDQTLGPTAAFTKSSAATCAKLSSTS